MNNILKIGIIWMLISIPFVFLVSTDMWRYLLTGGIGVSLVIIGYAIEVYRQIKYDMS
jgi:hypothetical protein